MNSIGFCKFLAAITILGSTATFVRAANCTVTNGGLPCRELSSGDIGGSYCFQPDAMSIREVTSTSGATSIWLTKEVQTDPFLYDISVDTVGLKPGKPAAVCKQKKDLLQGRKIRVTFTDGKYFMTIFPPENTDPSKKIKIEMVEGGKNGARLWLFGKHNYLQYYLMLRDKYSADNRVFPKYLYVVAFDEQDGNCEENAPSYEENVVLADAESVCAARGFPLGFLPSGGVAETGVGGGGERKGP